MITEGRTEVLAKLDHAEAMLAESCTLSEVKKIRDIAAAARVYFKAAHLGHEAQNYAAEIADLASCKAGEILMQLEKTPKESAATVSGDSEYRQALNDTGTSERTAQRWQERAKVPEPVVQQYKEATRKAGGEITVSGLLQFSKLRSSVKRPPPQTPNTSNIMETLSSFLFKLGELNGFTKRIKTPVTEQMKVEIDNVIVCLMRISKDAAERAERLNTALKAKVA